MSMKIVVLLSGGVESSALLYKAINESTVVYPLFFNYGQRAFLNEKQAIDRLIESIPSDYRRFVRPIKIIDISNLNIFNSSLIHGNTHVPVIDRDRRHIEDPAGDSTNVPFRNIIFISLAVAYAESERLDEVHIGVKKQGADMPATHWDGNPETINKFKVVVSMGTNGKVKLVAPFECLGKSEVMEMSRSFKVPLDLNLTWSCYTTEEPDGKPCGVCRACIERQVEYEKI